MYLSTEVSEFFDQRLKELANKFRPANGKVLDADKAEEPYRKVLEESLKKLSGRVDKDFVDTEIREHVYKDSNQPNDLRISQVIMYALDYYSRPRLMKRGYSEEEAYNLWSAYMAEGGYDKLFDEISDFDGSVKND